LHRIQKSIIVLEYDDGYDRRMEQPVRREDDTELQDLPRKTHLRPDEVARFLSISLKTVYRRHRSGIIEGSRVTGALRISRDSVVRLVEENNSPPVRSSIPTPASRTP